MADLRNGRLLRLVAASAALYAIAAIATSAPVLILVLNDLLMAASVGVCIAYAPLMPEALTSPRPTKGLYLGAGVFFVSACMLLLRIIASAARDFGWADLYNTDIVTFAYALGLVGALLHLLAPGVADGRVPPERWARTGLAVATGVFLALICWSVHTRLAEPPVLLLR